MRKRGSGRHWLTLLVLLLLLVLPATASAATTVRVFPAAPYRVQHLTPLAAPPVVIGASAVRYFAVAPGYGPAGVQGASLGLQGTTTVLPACDGACTDRYRPASAVAIAAGHYTERVIFTVTQPGRAGPAFGFDLEIAVHLTTGWVFGMGYFSSGVATTAGTATISLRLYVDLGTADPTVEAVEVTVNACLTTTGCP